MVGLHLTTQSLPALSLRKFIWLTFLLFRIRAAIILMKLCFATGVLAIPSALGVVGYGPGVILLVCWGSMTTCMYSLLSKIIFYNSRLSSRLCLHYVHFPDEIPRGSQHIGRCRSYGGPNCTRSCRRLVSVDVDVSLKLIPRRHYGPSSN